TLMPKVHTDIPDAKIANERVDAVVIDEEWLDSLIFYSFGCGGKILQGDGTLESYHAKEEA
ncbi:hypothetical protein M8C21_023632, partial [Ambrosia artemisiifolia]